MTIENQTKPRVLLVVAHDGFQPIEYSEPKKILEQAGVEVITASDQAGVAVSSFEGAVNTAVDLVLPEVAVADYDGLFFIGGPGAMENLDNKESDRIIKESAVSGKPFGAICVSPRILAKAGVLRNKKATGWDGDNKLEFILKSAGAEYIKQPVVVDGSLVTASGPEAAKEFGMAIVGLLKGY